MNEENSIQPKSDNSLMSEQDRKKIAELRRNANEGMNSINIRYVEFNGKDGIYRKSSGKKDEAGRAIKEEMGNGFQGIIVKNRNRVNVYDPKRKESSHGSMRSDEFDSVNDPIVVYNQDKQIVGRGSYRELKNQMPIKMEKVLYVKVPNDDTFIKLSVSGMSLKSFFDYLKSFEMDDSSSRYLTIFGSRDDNNEFGEYKVMTFTRGEAQDIDQILELQKGLNLAIMVNEKSKSGNVARIDDEIEIVKDENSEVDMSNIPF